MNDFFEWLWSPFGMGAWVWFFPIAVLVAVIGGIADRVSDARKRKAPQ